MKKYQFCVVTSVPDPSKDDGNLAAAILHGNLPKELKLAAMLHGRVEVFHLGEIIVLDDDGRELGGQMRKPSKWFIETECFENAYDAITRAIQVLDEKEKHENKKIDG